MDGIQQWAFTRKSQFFLWAVFPSFTLWPIWKENRKFPGIPLLWQQCCYIGYVSYDYCKIVHLGPKNHADTEGCHHFSCELFWNLNLKMEVHVLRGRKTCCVQQNVSCLKKTYSSEYYEWNLTFLLIFVIKKGHVYLHLPIACFFNDMSLRILMHYHVVLTVACLFIRPS